MAGGKPPAPSALIPECKCPRVGPPPDFQNLADWRMYWDPVQISTIRLPPAPASWWVGMWSCFVCNTTLSEAELLSPNVIAMLASDLRPFCQIHGPKALLFTREGETKWTCANADNQTDTPVPNGDCPWGVRADAAAVATIEVHSSDSDGDAGGGAGASGSGGGAGASCGA